jgi:hypothetical protein
MSVSGHNFRKTTRKGLIAYYRCTDCQISVEVDAFFREGHGPSLIDLRQSLLDESGDPGPFNEKMSCGEIQVMQVMES